MTAALRVRPCPAWYLLCICVFSLLCIPSSSRATPGQGVSAESLVEQYEQRRRAIADMMEAATVFIHAVGSEEGATGSGFIVGDGLIMTNGHVVDELGGALEIHVLNSRIPARTARIVAMEHDRNMVGRDFALLRFTPPAEGAALPALAFNVELRRTDRVSAWGFPGAVREHDKSGERIDAGEIVLPPLVYTDGTVSAFVEQNVRSILHTAYISSGNSGGPLVNTSGEVVGINCWAVSPDSGVIVNASLPAADVIAFMRRHGFTPAVNGPERPAYAAAPSPSESAAAPALSPTTGPTPEPRSEPGIGQQPGGLFGKTRPNGPQNTPENGSSDKRPGGIPSAPETSVTASAIGPGGGLSGQGEAPGDTRDVIGLPVAEVLRLAESGNVQAMLHAGLSLLGGASGFAKNPGLAWQWLAKAHGTNSLEAAEVYSTALVTQGGSPGATAKGLALMRETAALPGCAPQFKAFLSWLLFEGMRFGVTPDYPESFHWAEEAAAKGNAMGAAMLALHYFEGVAVNTDMAKAKALADQAAAAGESPLAESLQALFRYMDAETPQENSAVIPLAERAARKGATYAQGLLAIMYAFDDDCGNPVLAEQWAREAAGKGNYLGQYVLGWLYMTGAVVERDYAMAWAYLDLAMQDAEDFGADPDGPLLEKLESLMSADDRKRGEAVQRGWLFDWGLRDTP